MSELDGISDETALKYLEKPYSSLSPSEIQDKLDQMVFFWEDIKARAEEREIKFLDVLELAEKFWYDMAALLTTIRDTQDIVHDLESPGIDPSIIKQQVEAAEVRGKQNFPYVCPLAKHFIQVCCISCFIGFLFCKSFFNLKTPPYYSKFL